MNRRLCQLLLAVTAGAQAPPTFRAGTQLVQVGVIAQDGKGNAVADLRSAAKKALVGNQATGRLGTLTIPMPEVGERTANAK